MKKLILGTIALSLFATSPLTMAKSKGERKFDTANSFYFGIFNLKHLTGLEPSEKTINVNKYNNESLNKSKYSKMYLPDFSLETDPENTYIKINAKFETKEDCKSRVWREMGSYYVRTYQHLAMRDESSESWIIRSNGKALSNISEINKNDFDYVDDGYSVKASFNYIDPKRVKKADSILGEWLIEGSCSEDGSFYYHSKNVYEFDNKTK